MVLTEYQMLKEWLRAGGYRQGRILQVQIRSISGHIFTTDTVEELVERMRASGEAKP